MRFERTVYRSLAARFKPHPSRPAGCHSRLPFSAPGSRLPPRSLLLPAAKVATGDPQPRSLLRFARCPLDTRNSVVASALRAEVATGDPQPLHLWRGLSHCAGCLLVFLRGGRFGLRLARPRPAVPPLKTEQMFVYIIRRSTQFVNRQCLEKANLRDKYKKTDAHSDVRFAVRLCYTSLHR